MNVFFKSAVERFNKLKKEKEFLIAPISQEDAEIIDELRVILKKSGRDDVCEILKTYKEYKDSEIKDTLLQWNIDHVSLGLKKLIDKTAEKLSDEVDEQERTWSFIEIGDLSLRSFDILGYERLEKRDKYCIKLNPTPDHAKSIPLYANYIIEFESEDYRNKIIDNLTDFLESQGINTIKM